MVSERVIVILKAEIRHFTCVLVHAFPPLSMQPLNELLFISAFGGLSWSDTQTATKCTNIAGLLLEKVQCSIILQHHISHNEFLGFLESRA